MEQQPKHQRPVPRVPEPIEFDPFEMDWPWPGMMSSEEPPAEPSRCELPAEDQAESAVPLRSEPE